MLDDNEGTRSKKIDEQILVEIKSMSFMHVIPYFQIIVQDCDKDKRRNYIS